MRGFTAIAAGALLALSPLSNAAIVTQYGDDVSFTYDDSTLFGTGTVVGNSIFFLPTDFLAESYDGAGIDSTTDTLNLTIETTNAAFLMDNYQLVEQGDYRLDGAASGASVDASAYMSVTSNTMLCGGLFPCSMNSVFSAGALADTGGALDTWSLNGMLDLDNTAGWGADTDVTVQLQNNLLAETVLSGQTAFIQKKQGAIGVVVNPVPLPAAVWLFGAGLLGLLGIARRDRA